MRRIAPFLALIMSCHATPTETRDHFQAADGSRLSYLLIRPDPAALPRDLKPPLVVFLHGSGERGDDLEMVKLHGPPKQALQGAGLPFVVLAPQCPKDQWWDADSVIALIEHIATEEPIDRERIHLTGLSMGGFATWEIVARQPELFASAVPVCGGGDPSTADTFKHLPVWAFHGEKDKVVPAEKTREMERALEEAGAKQLRTTYYPKVGHDSWNQAYSEPALYAWMMLQRNASKKP